MSRGCRSETDLPCSPICGTILNSGNCSGKTTTTSRWEADYQSARAGWKPSPVKILELRNVLFVRSPAKGVTVANGEVPKAGNQRVAKFGIVLGLEPRDRRFESCPSDQFWGHLISIRLR